MLRILSRKRATVLGPLEDQIMIVLWSASAPMTVSQVHSALPQRKPIAYSTVKAVLTNLTAKGYLTRKSAGRSNSFSPKMSRDEFQERMIGDVLNSLMQECRAPLLAHLVDGLAADEDTIREIRHLLSKKEAEIRER